jgi:hypothetical protein
MPGAVSLNLAEKTVLKKKISITPPANALIHSTEKI